MHRSGGTCATSASCSSVSVGIVFFAFWLFGRLEDNLAEEL